MKIFPIIMASLLLCPAGLAQSSNLKVGDKAPDFELPDQNGKTVRLSDFQSKKNVALAFYVLAFTGG